MSDIAAEIRRTERSITAYIGRSFGAVACLTCESTTARLSEVATDAVAGVITKEEAADFVISHISSCPAAKQVPEARVAGSVTTCRLPTVTTTK